MAKVTKKKAPGKGIALYKEKMAQSATQAMKAEQSAASGGAMIGLASGRFTYKGETFKDTTLHVVVLDFIFENVLYVEDYDSDNPETPSCFALERPSEDGQEPNMKPHEQALEPRCKVCDDCELNEWGSADTGRGKACKNTRRLAVVLVDDLNNIETCEVAFLKLPVTSVKGWASYVQQLGSLHAVPPFGAVTQIELVPDTKTQFVVDFSLVDLIEDAKILDGIFKRLETFGDTIMFPYVKQAEPVERKKTRKGTAAKKMTRKAPAKKAPARKGATKKTTTRKTTKR